MESLPKVLQDIIEKGYREHYWWYQHIESWDDLIKLAPKKKALYLELFLQDGQTTAAESILEHLNQWDLSRPSCCWANSVVRSTFRSVVQQHLPRAWPYLFDWLTTHHKIFSFILPPSPELPENISVGMYWSLLYAGQSSNVEFLDYLVFQYPQKDPSLIQKWQFPLRDFTVRLTIRYGTLKSVKYLMAKDESLRSNVKRYLQLADELRKSDISDYFRTLINPSYKRI